MFLKKTNSCVPDLILVSSEAGYLNFWSLSQKLLGGFYASAFIDQSILAMSTDANNNVIIACDTKGFIYIWDIRKRDAWLNGTFNKPQLLNSWRCHDSAVTSCEYISNAERAFSSELICTASTDYCCRLWTIDGVYVGVFGQEDKWNLKNSKTFQSHYINNLDDTFREANGIQIIYEDQKSKYDIPDQSAQKPTLTRRESKRNIKVLFEFCFNKLLLMYCLKNNVNYI